MIRLRPTRVLALGAAVLVAFLYWKPLGSYTHTKAELQTRQAQVASLRAEEAQLRRKIALAGTKEELTRQARKLGEVKPNEQLFIVRGINAWRKHH